ncbi:ATP-grasp domain-containing protein [Myroides odoratimimus]|uniref:ATP-grasp domain-containing protein n=1 Tax=Myroides odoratimimus CIP 101113 TaxID=883154 RepID=A0AAV3F1S2_9FLAO|nr:ATP-grasp domain-containing protein [Myroides odoratimimus]EHO09927.1 hypothetical protein HMPREF9715_02228 [Myroides odoratimimus CIP 101113]
MSKLKLAILGASYLQLPLVLKAKEMGLEIHCFAWDDGKAICKNYVDFFYPISVLEKEEILTVCDKVGINGVLTIATDICIPTIAYVASNLGLVGNTIECAKLTTDKKLMRELLMHSKLNCPKSLAINSKELLEELIFDYPVIVKPSDRSGSLGVAKVYNTIELKDAVEFALDVSLSKNCLIEEFIEGREISVETISYQGRHRVIAITDKIITEEPYFVEIEHHQPSNLPVDIKRRIEEDTINILNVFGVTNGAGHLEYRITENNEIYLIEIGSRMGGDFIGSDLVQLSTGFDYLKAVIEVAIGKYTWNEQMLLNKFSGVYFLGKETEYLLPYFNSNNSEIVKKERISELITNLKNSNDRSGYFIYQGDSRLRVI